MATDTRSQCAPLSLSLENYHATVNGSNTLVTPRFVSMELQHESGSVSATGTALGSAVLGFGIGSARWSDGSSPSRVTHWFNLIPASGVGEAVGGVTEAVGDDKMGGGQRNIQQRHDQ